MRRSRPLRLAVLVALAASVLVVGVSAAAAATAGNPANAELCQKGGWRDLVISTGPGFASEGNCVIYAALRCPNCEDVALMIGLQDERLVVEWRGRYEMER